MEMHVPDREVVLILLRDLFDEAAGRYPVNRARLRDIIAMYNLLGRVPTRMLKKYHCPGRRLRRAGCADLPC